MSKTYDMIAGSLQELIDDYETTGGKNLAHDTFRIELEPAKEFSAEDVKDIRKRNHLTQSLLAKFLCVSKRECKIVCVKGLYKSTLVLAY